MEIPVPRDGGIGALLREASRPERRFDAVICESIDRIARHTDLATEVEYRLEQAGVVLWAADEPIRATGWSRRGRSATEVLIRRVKQGVAEWYVTELLEKSWAGFEIHAEQGFNVGKPCYGYRARKVSHPVPARRAKSAWKTLLEVHPVEGPVVSRCFVWRVAEELGYRQIADLLNADLLAYPPPVPVDVGRAAGRWTRSSVREVLTNPKYTGHMVWNRRARKGNGRNRLNPVEEWVWSTTPAHAALVDLETFVRAQEVAERRQRSRGAPGANRHRRPGASTGCAAMCSVSCAAAAYRASRADGPPTTCARPRRNTGPKGIRPVSGCVRTRSSTGSQTFCASTSSARHGVNSSKPTRKFSIRSNSGSGNTGWCPCGRPSRTVRPGAGAWYRTWNFWTGPTRASSTSSRRVMPNCVRSSTPSGNNSPPS
ncbi:recombinase family protein [Streptomyces sp. NPDC050211]|uniref:recombinase family protein n=1 Tax=Streptomyces sp. NPDC050211 TaxID=3154932 RepID=UPI00342835A4